MPRILTAACLVGVHVMANASLRAGAARQSLRVGDALPKLKGQTLTGRTAVLPQSPGKVTLVAIGFTYKSRFPVEAWAEWYRATIGSRTDVTFCEAEHKDDAYVIALDRDGLVQWRHHGGFDLSRADDLHALLTSLADRGPTAADHHLAPRSVQP